MSETELPSLKNHLLVAMPGLADPNFKNAVIYICEHSEEGAMGLVINQPSDVTLSRVFDELDLQYGDDAGKQPLMVGGPVQQERGFVLHRAATQRWESTLYVTPDVCITASRDIIADMAQQKGPASGYITLGYAGWGPGQLENELAHNSWLLSEADPGILFDTPVDQRLAATASKVGVDLERMSTQAGHA